MSAHATGTFEVKAWDEKPFDEIDGGGKLTRASVTKSFHGDIEGEGKVEYLMMHRADRSAIFVGLERVTGRLGDRSGSFVLQHSGTFDGKAARGTLVVVTGSGTGELHGLRAEGGFVAEHGPKGSMTLDYDFQ